MNIKKERLQEEVKHLASRFLMLNSSKDSLITVTKIEMSNDKKNAIIFFTAFPDKEEKDALSFAKRKRSEFKQFIRDNSRIARIPHIDFAIDIGEKNRQNIDRIIQQ
jgi:ribosome-binding factor A